jgi:hypothetical protein
MCRVLRSASQNMIWSGPAPQAGTRHIGALNSLHAERMSDPCLTTQGAGQPTRSVEMTTSSTQRLRSLLACW